VLDAATAADLQHHTAEINGLSMHYVSAGHGEPIVFVHGFPTSWYTWRHQLAEFAATNRVIAPDMRGWGETSKPQGAPNYGVRVIVEDLRVLIDQLGFERVTMVGDDWGGLISWAFALHYPERLQRLVIVSSPHPACFDRELKHSPAQQEASQYLLQLRAIGIEEQLAADECAALRRAILDLPFYAPADREVYLENWQRPGALRAGCDWYRAAWLGPAAPDGTPAHGNYVPDVFDQRVLVPTLMVKAQGCPYFLDGTVDGLDEWVPDLRIEMVPTLSHWIAEEQPDVLNGHIRAFLDG